MKIKHERDIAAHEAAAKTIKYAYQTTRNILEQAPFGIYVVNSEGFVEYFNAAMIRISGRPVESIKDLNVFEIPAYKNLSLDERSGGP